MYLLQVGQQLLQRRAIRKGVVLGVRIPPTLWRVKEKIIYIISRGKIIPFPSPLPPLAKDLSIQMYSRVKKYVKKLCVKLPPGGNPVYSPVTTYQIQ